MEIEPKTFRLISLGCPKNLVDSEVMGGKLLAAGWHLVPDGPAQLCLVNTCAFVEDAAQESVDILLEQAEYKAEGGYELLVASGCLPEKYRAEVAQAIEGVDAEIGAEDFPQIVSIVENLLGESPQRVFLSEQKYLYDHNTERVLSGPPWRAYLKLSEGCDNHCSYCIIGRLRGKFRSRDFDSVITEANNLADMGVKELVLVAQDTTHYGADKPGAPGLAQLLAELNKIDPLRWIRILYAHPAHLTENMLEAMAANDKVLHYLDLPLQHASDQILKRMNRNVTRARIDSLLTTARSLMPDILLRTTFIVGLPGETEDDFAQLLEFANQWRIPNVGGFAYSPEEGTPAFSMEPKVPAEVAEKRLDELMTLQAEIAEEVWSGFVGKKLEVLVEEDLAPEEDDDFTHVGRIYGQAPEIDGVTFLRSQKEIAPGSIVKARIIDSTDYDLFADIE